MKATKTMALAIALMLLLTACSGKAGATSGNSTSTPSSTASTSQPVNADSNSSSAASATTENQPSSTPELDNSNQGAPSPIVSGSTNPDDYWMGDEFDLDSYMLNVWGAERVSRGPQNIVYSTPAQWKIDLGPSHFSVSTEAYGAYTGTGITVATEEMVKIYGASVSIGHGILNLLPSVLLATESYSGSGCPFDATNIPHRSHINPSN